MLKSAALVTWSGLPQLAADDRLLAAELARRGVRADAAVWDDRAVDWSSYDAVILRSTWDYHKRVGEFVAWVDELRARGVRLWNPAAVVCGNVHKRYLVELARRGYAVVPTELVPRGSGVRLRDVMDARGWGRVVVKPAVSATAFRTFVCGAPPSRRPDTPASGRPPRRRRDQPAGRRRAEADFDALLEDVDVLVQPFLDEVAADGEWSLVFFGGHFSHAVIKRPSAGDFRVQSDFGGSAERREPPPRLIGEARALLQAVGQPLLYARVDGVDRDGRFMLMELELTEPSLFLDPSAAVRLADAALSII